MALNLISVLPLLCEGIMVVCIGSSPTQGEAIVDKVITTVMIGVGT